MNLPMANWLADRFLREVLDSVDDSSSSIRKTDSGERYVIGESRIWQKLSLNRSDFEPPQHSARIR